MVDEWEVYAHMLYGEGGQLKGQDTTLIIPFSESGLTMRVGN